MTEKKASKRRGAKVPALFLEPLPGDRSSPVKAAIWNGVLPREKHEEVDVSHIGPLASPPSLKQLEDRAGRIQHKIASWDREKLEIYYTRNLLSALLLRKSQRVLGAMLPILTAMAGHRASYQDLRKKARLAVLYANMLLQPELARRRGYSKGGVKGAAERRNDAAEQHDRWYVEQCKFVERGGNPRDAASVLAERFQVTAHTIRKGIKKAKQARAESAHKN